MAITLEKPVYMHEETDGHLANLSNLVFQIEPQPVKRKQGSPRSPGPQMIVYSSPFFGVCLKAACVLFKSEH